MGIKSFIFIATMIFLFSCDKHEFKNPVDTDVELQELSEDLTIARLSDSSVILSWQKNTDVVVKYIVERKKNSGSYAFQEEVEANTTQYIDTGLLTTNTYYYKITGFNDQNYTNSISDSIITYFSPVTNFNITHESITSAKLTWTHDCTYETGYIIERRNITNDKTEKLKSIKDSKKMLTDNQTSFRKEQKDENEFQVIAEISSDNFAYIDNSLIPNQQYEYRFKAISNFNESNSILANYYSNFPKPRNLSITQSNVHTFFLEWDDFSNNENGFMIERKIDEGDYSVIYSTAENVTNFTDDINTRNTFGQIYYKIYGFYVDEEIIFSDFIEAQETIVFEQITNLSYEKLLVNSIQLYWLDSNDGTEGYIIEKMVSNSEYQEIANVDTIGFIDTSVEVNPNIRYRVAPYSGDNIAEFTETEEIDNSLTSPTDLSFELIDNSIRLNWNDNSEGEDGFKIDKKVGSSDWQVVFGEVEEDIETWTDENAIDDDVIEYRVCTFYGENISSYSEVSFGCIDIDGNFYQTIQVGNQFWTTESLKVTHYRNGDAITHVPSNGNWSSTENGAYCMYNDSPGNGETYGNMYNWYAVNDSRNIAPQGWHVPSDDELKELEMTLGMSQYEANSTDLRGTNEGSKLSFRADLWQNGALEDDTDFNSSGFKFLPGGSRRCIWSDDYQEIGSRSYIWTSTQNYNGESWYRGIDHDDTRVARNDCDKNYGFYLRCVKD